MRLSELSNTISTKADTTWCPAPSCSFCHNKISQHEKTSQFILERGMQSTKSKQRKHTWRRACLSSLRIFWNRSLRTKRMAKIVSITKIGKKGKKVKVSMLMNRIYVIQQISITFDFNRILRQHLLPWKKFVFPDPLAPTAKNI